MTRIIITLLFASTVLIAGGCGRQIADSGPQSQGNEGEVIRSGSQPNAQLESPGGTVSLFLKALRDGDEARTVNLMTAQARKAVDSSEQVSFGLQDTDGIVFRVGETRFLSDQKKMAHVEVQWDGTDVVFALRSEERGWRIAGFAAPLVPDGPLEYLNFEKPAEILAKINAPRGDQEASVTDPNGSSGVVEQADARTGDTTRSPR